jgi:hypothetical protein
MKLMEKTIITGGGRIKAPRCQARSKRTKIQFGLTAARGKRVCRFHGAKSTGPKTLEGRRRCAAAKTLHGTDPREMRKASRAKMRELNALYEMLPWFAKGRL